MDASPSRDSERDPHSPPLASNDAPREDEDVLAEVIALTRRFAGASSLKYADAAAIVATGLLRPASEDRSHHANAFDADERPDGTLVSDALRSVDTEAGRLRTFLYLTSGPYPRFHALPGIPGYLLRTESDGTQTLGKFVGRDFKTAS